VRGARANGKELRVARLRRGLTQEQLAALADVDVKTVRKAEHGMRLDLGSLTRLAFALKKELNRLIRLSRSETEIQIRRRDVVIRWHRAWDARDMEAILTDYHEHAVMHLPGGPNIPFGGTFRGKDEIRRAFGICWSTCRTEPERAEDFSLLVSDNSVVLTGPKGVYLPSGELARLWCLQVFTFEGNLIFDHRVEYDTLKFAELLQLPRQTDSPGNSPETSR
jgi:transcriptional regulator with XRE-family HTH domain